MKYETIKEYSERRFKQITGVTRPTYEAMLEEVKAAYIKRHSKPAITGGGISTF